MNQKKSYKSVYDLEYKLLNTRYPSDVSLCEKIYKFWLYSWQETFSSLEKRDIKAIFSDDFLDREVSALLYDGQPVALFFNNWFDLTRDSILNHSYFKNHPSQVIEFYKQNKFRKVMALTYMTIHPEWRNNQTNVYLPELLFSLSIKRFFETNSEVLIGYIRTDKSFFSTFYNHGASKILSSIAYNVPVDFCYIKLDQARLSPDLNVRRACDFLWSERLNKFNEQKEAA